MFRFGTELPGERSKRSRRLSPDEEKNMQFRQTTAAALKKPAQATKIQGASKMLMTLGPLLLAAFLGAAGQLLLKYGMSQIGALQLDAASIPSNIVRMLTSPYVIGGLLVFGMGTFFWLVVMSRVPLSYLYPFASLGIVLGLLAAWLFFHEYVSPLRWLGMLVICVGVGLIARS
jgi:drug/metabolite transporter (DMT)-like permease